MGVFKPEGVANVADYAFRIADHIVVPVAQHLETSPAQIRVTLLIGSKPGLHIVLPPINLDDEAGGEAGEVDNEMIHRRLAPKMKSF